MSSTRRLSLNALLLATLCVASFLNIPLPFLAGAITGTTLAMCLIALVRPPRDTFLIITLYLIMGAIGLPVFAGGGGFAKFIGPAAGYYYSWPIAFTLLSACLTKVKSQLGRYLLALLITIPIIYGMGAIGLTLTLKMPLWSAILGQAVYLPGDLIKYAVALIAAQQVKNLWKD